MAEAAAAVDAVEVVDDVPLHLVDALHDELGDAVAAVHVVVVRRVRVQQHDLDLSAVGGVDQPR